MRIDILTLFPEMFAPLKESILGRAQKDGKLQFNVVNLRDYTEDKHLKCDDYPFGGGAGMVMMPQPIGSAIDALDPEHKARRIYMSPKGEQFKQQKVFELLGYEHLILLCGHYEGVDQRAIDLFIDEEISIGDYVLTGGELPAMVVADCAKKQKSVFEQNFLSQFDAQFEQAEHQTEILHGMPYEDYYQEQIANGSMLHGNFTHHSVLWLEGNLTAVTGFDKAVAGIRILDFYLLFRKMMEKWEWEISLGDSMLCAYNRIRPIPAQELKLLKLLLYYPEKFWKVANQYYNNRKSWIPEKNMQKLLQTMDQAEKKKESIQAIFT